ncbi:MAG: TolC family protein [Nitrospira sp.]|nr:TolC family protein [Nitrospira sp.]
MLEKPCFGERGGVIGVVMLMLVATTSVVWAGDEGNPGQSLSLPTLSLTLREALSAAADNNPDVLLYQERIQEARGQVQTQLGALLPNLSADVRQSRRTQFLGTIGLSPVRTDPFSIFDARISATQQLFSLSLIQRWRASRHSLHTTEQEAEAKKLDTMASVALVYMEGLRAMALIKAHESNQQIMKELLGTVRQRQRGGLATGLDIARLEAQLAAERQQSSSSRYELDHATFSLINLLALPTNSTVVLNDEWLTDVP